MDFTAHNEEANAVWEAYWAGAPTRVPVGNFTIGPRIWLLDPALNTRGITWRQFSEDPSVMWDVQLQYHYHLRHHIPCDQQMGVPEDHWDTFVEFVNVTDEAWLGGELVYPEGQVVTTIPRYTGEARKEFPAMDIPDPFSGIYARVREFYEYFLDRAERETFHDRPIEVALPSTGLGTDGPLTVGLGLCGEEILCDMLADPETYRAIMNRIADATIAKVRAWRDYLGLPAKPATGCFADDAIQHISTQAYVENVLPFHRKILDALYDGGPFHMHLCGDVQRHLPTVARELNIELFDTGYPIEFSSVREQLGDAVHIQGGVPVQVLVAGSAEDVRIETRRILASGITRGGRFILKEANNVPPRVPAANLRVMYETAREYGTY